LITPPELMVMVPKLTIVPSEFVMVPVTTNVTPWLIVKVFPKLIVRDPMVHVLVPESQVPPMLLHEGPSDIVPPVA
jgi:hypothetical protein